MNWTCPHCHHPQTLTDPKIDRGSAHLDIRDNAYGDVGLQWGAVGCSNPNCRQIQLTVHLVSYGFHKTFGWIVQEGQPAKKSWPLLPDSNARPWPEYIPQQIRDDYREACLIKNLSPKASATLARRCLQGMIRDFGKVKPGRLVDEIQRLADAVKDGSAPRDVSIDSIAALTSLRKIGNIGAHMEADVDLIVPVEPGEADAIIGMIELLLDEWYVERQKRTERFAQIAEIEQEKAQFIANAKAQKALPPPEAKPPEGENAS